MIKRIVYKVLLIIKQSGFPIWPIIPFACGEQSKRLQKKAENAIITYFKYRISLKDCQIWTKGTYDNLYVRDDSPVQSFGLVGAYTKQNVPSTEDKYISIADNLYFLAHRYFVQQYALLLEQFKPVAGQYRALQTKLPVSEEQRKYIMSVAL